MNKSIRHDLTGLTKPGTLTDIGQHLYRRFGPALQELGHFGLIEHLRAGSRQDRIDQTDAFLIVLGLAMGVDRFFRREDLVDEKAVFILRVPQDIEADIARLVARAFVIDAEGFDEFRSMAWFHFDADQLNNHICIPGFN